MIKKASLLFFFVLSVFIFGQRLQLEGIVVDVNNRPVKNVIIQINQRQYKIEEKGVFKISVANNKVLKIKVSSPNYISFSKILNLKKKTDYRLNIILKKEKSTPIESVTLKGKKEYQDIGNKELDLNKVNKISSASGAVEELLKTQPGVNSNNELSSQYMVRGGNYDENLIYVNGIEWYRPQLVRSGIQEGLSFLNPTLVKSAYFSAGGFPVKYGDKISSVLNIVYKQPTGFEGSFDASLLGGGLTIGNASSNKKLSAIIGARYSDKRLLVSRRDTDVDFNPVYFDLQTSVNYDINSRINMNFLGSFSKNDLDLFPKSRETTFGTINNLYKLRVNYTGWEKDLFEISSGAFTINFKPSKRLKLSTNLALHHSKEKEHFDINSRYLLGNTDPTTGGFTTTFDSAGQIDHGRNDLDLLITSFEHKGTYGLGSGKIQWGIKIRKEDIKNRLNEYHRVDSAGFIKPVSSSSGFHYLYKVTNINKNYYLNNNRISGYIQYADKHQLSKGKLMYSVGVRATHWSFNRELNISPRAQIAYQPDRKRELQFRFSTGLYYQPPFYKEIRDVFGNPNKKIKAQQSIHFIIGNDYGFKLKKQRFKLTSEAYLKINNHLIPYYIDNIRTVYIGENSATGQQYGLDMKLSAALIPDSESFISMSYARSKWNINHRGNIPTPTDQRLKINVFFQDYMPAFPSFKVHLNAIYASGLPNGAPLYTDPYNFSRRLNDYRRLDIGFTKIFIDEHQFKVKKNSFWSNFKELSVSLDIFNLLNIENHISNLWVQDLTNSQYLAVPNRLIGRLFNVKLHVKF